MLKIPKILCLLLIINCSIISSDAFLVFVIRNLAQVGQDLVNVAKGEIPLSGVLIGTQKYKMQNLLKHVQDVASKLEEMSRTINSKLDKVMSAIAVTLPLKGELDAGMREFHNLLERIESLWASYKTYSTDLSSFNELTIEKWINAITDFSSGSLPNVLNQLRSLFAPSTEIKTRPSLFDTMVEYRLETQPDPVCNEKFSYQRHMAKIFEIIIAQEIRAFFMTTFAYGVLSAYKNTTFTREIFDAESKFVLRSKAYIDKISESFAKAPRDTILCGNILSPKRDVTYAELEGFVQKYVTNVREVTGDDSCYNDCGDIWSDKTYRCSERSDGWDVKKVCVNPQPCRGLISGCGYLGGSVDVCFAPENSTRRYMYVDGKYTWYGPRVSCPSNKDYHTDFNYGWYNCEMCLCNCIEDHDDSDAVRTISLRPLVSDIDNNMVIVAVKFYKADNVIYIKAGQGELTEGGLINKHALKPVELETFTYNKDDRTFSIGDNQLEHKKDYVKLSRNQRAINLDDVQVEPGYLITGIRLNFEDPSDSTSRLQLEVLATPFDIKTGKLNPTDDKPSIWVTPQNMKDKPPQYDRERKSFYDSDADNPELTENTYPATETNQWVQFETTAHYKDAGQSTIPFFDLSAVLTKPFIALDTIGIFIERETGIGGFLSFKLRNIDLSKYADSTLTAEELKMYQKKSLEATDEEEPIIEDPEDFEF